MSAYRRHIMTGAGPVDVAWFCSEECYRENLADDPPTEVYPQGAEHDGRPLGSPQACATCGEPVAHPMTERGHDTLRDWLAFRGDSVVQSFARVHALGGERLWGTP